MNCYSNKNKKRISQGDIIRNLRFTINSEDKNSNSFYLKSSPLDCYFSYAVVLSQECDLEQHYSLVDKNNISGNSEGYHDQIIETLLICPAFAIDLFLSGNHISGKRMNDFKDSNKKRVYEKIKRNDEFNRFHFLPRLENYFPELVIDFKRFYTIPLEIFKDNFNDFYLASIEYLYREKLSQRFANYLSRIGLPNSDESDENDV